MIDLPDFLECIQFKITEGSQFMWNCFGPNAFHYDHDADDYALTAVFDTETREVYEVQVFDYLNNRAYRVIHCCYIEAFLKECKTRGINPNKASDDMDMIDVAFDDDFLEKAKAIINGNDYDPEVKTKYGE